MSASKAWKSFGLLRSGGRIEDEQGAVHAGTGNRLQKGRPPPICTEDPIDQDVYSPSTASPGTPRSGKNVQHYGLKPNSRVSSLLNLNKSKNPAAVSSWNHDDTPCSPVQSGIKAEVHPKKEKNGALKREDILHHGEILVPSPAVRGLGSVQSKSQYAVLTTNQFIRFRTQQQALQWTSMLQEPNMDQYDRKRTLSKSALAQYSSSFSTGDISAVDLTDVVSVYNLDDGRPYFTIEIACLEENKGELPLAWVVTVHIEEPQEFELWLYKLRSSCAAASQLQHWVEESYLLRYAKKWIGQDGQFDIPSGSGIFKVVQRTSHRASIDTARAGTTPLCLMAVGLHKIYIIPIPKVNKDSAFQSARTIVGRSYGLTTLTKFRSQLSDETFHLHFRLPLQQATEFVLSSSAVGKIMNRIWRAVHYLRPAWQASPFDWIVPGAPDEIEQEETNTKQTFIRTVEAYCAAYDCSHSDIRWRTELEVEDAPRFVLLPRNNGIHQIYTIYELLAVLRALRYDQYYSSVSFAGVDLTPLQLPDTQGSDHELWRTQGGQRIESPDKQDVPFSLLGLELRAVFLASKRLRRIDFSGCFLSPHSIPSQPVNCRSSILEAILPLCERQHTNVDWICLNGNNLSRDDVDFLYSAMMQKVCHFRSIELNRCCLEDHDLRNILQICEAQANTLESINISGNPGLLEASTLLQSLKPIRHLRRLELSDLNLRNAGQSFLTFEVLSTWRLEQLELSGTSLSVMDLDHLMQYMRTDTPLCLAWLGLNRCKLTGGDIGRLLKAMHKNGRNHNLHLEVSGNHLEASGEHRELVEAIERSETPAYLVLENYEYKDIREYRRIIEAFAKNTTVKYLQMSGMAPRHIARDDKTTFELLRTMMAKNTAMENLALDGEVGHVDATNLGVKLGFAIDGLADNHTLTCLSVEFQSLGFAGAGALAEMIGENRVLRVLHIDNNDINLQGFTTIVDAVEHNETLIEVSPLHSDSSKDLKKIADEEGTPINGRPSKPKRTITMTMKKVGLDQNPFGAKPGRRSLLQEETLEAVSVRRKRWDGQQQRLQQFLDRNRRIARGRTDERHDRVNSTPDKKRLVEDRGSTESQDDRKTLVHTSDDFGSHLEITTSGLGLAG